MLGFNATPITKNGKDERYEWPVSKVVGNVNASLGKISLRQTPYTINLVGQGAAAKLGKVPMGSAKMGSAPNSGFQNVVQYLQRCGHAA